MLTFIRRRHEDLQVIHGYPMRYNAGSEVYTQGLAQALACRHEVRVFSRQENAFLPGYAMQRETDPADSRISLHLVNTARARDGYRHPAVDAAFAGLLDKFQPDIVHIGHLNHLSTSLVIEARDQRIPAVFTLHDYWFMCPGGSSSRCTPGTPRQLGGLRARTTGSAPSVATAATSAVVTPGTRRTLTTGPGGRQADGQVQEACGAVDVFIAPAMYLQRRFRDEFGLLGEKLGLTPNPPMDTDGRREDTGRGVRKLQAR